MKIFNKRAKFDYKIEETFEAGIVLYGHEVKAVRGGQVDLTGSHVRILGSEMYLIGAKIFQYKFARISNYDEKRTRKLLIHKKEIIALKNKLEGSNLTLVPLSLYTKEGLIKVEVALAKGKKKFEKKESIKKKDIQRELEQEYKL